MSDDLEIFEPPAPKVRQHKEASMQSWADRLIDRIVLPPMFTTGIDHASQITDNARARMAARGIRFGLPDVFVAQWNDDCRRSLWIELKRGAPVSHNQHTVHAAMREAGQNVTVCRTMAQIVEALRAARFRLHPNADALAAEYEARLVASEKAPAKPRAPGTWRAGKGKVSVARIQRVEKILRKVGR